MSFTKIQFKDFYCKRIAGQCMKDEDQDCPFTQRNSAMNFTIVPCWWTTVANAAPARFMSSKLLPDGGFDAGEIVSGKFVNVYRINV